ncbi:hypothetical protein AB0I60_02720 [Actinosynnema sp. NPDC050436]|uniref:hypothetical protein n=1 Tax=Actinosynnema sp. NPDC050436 TaxID=3155659 RepID=UPI0033D0AE70
MSTFHGGFAGAASTVAMTAAALLTGTPAADAVDCGASLTGWTGPKNVAIYKGSAGEVINTVTFLAGKVTSKHQRSGSVDTYQGSYTVSNVVHGPNKLTIDVEDAAHGVRDRIDFHAPRCNSAGRVTHAEISFGKGDIEGSINRTS